MKWIRTGLLVAVVAAAWIGVRFYEQYRSKQKIAADQEKKLGQFDANAVRAITLITRGDTIHATRQFGEQWVIERPVPWTGESSNWEAIVRNVRLAERERGWAVSPDSLHFYGLDPPRARVIFHLRGEGGRADTLDVGSTTPTESRCYVRVPPRDTVLTTTASVNSAAVRSLYDLRDKSVMPVKPEMIQRVTIAQGRVSLSFGREGSSWRMTSPTPRSADVDTVNALLRELSSARATAFHDKPTDLRAFGLQPPTAELQLVASIAGQTLEKRMLLGADVPGTGKGVIPAARYMMDPSGNSVMECPGSLFKNLMRPAANYWDRALTRFERRDVNRVSLVFPDSTITVYMDSAATWHFAEPHEYEGTCKRWRVNTLVADADLARGQEFIDGPGPFGFENPQFSLILYHDDEIKSRIDFGRSRGDMVYAKGSATDQVFLVEKQLMGKFQVSTFDLKELPLPEPQAHH